MYVKSTENNNWTIGRQKITYHSRHDLCATLVLNVPMLHSIQCAKPRLGANFPGTL